MLLNMNLASKISMLLLQILFKSFYIVNFFTNVSLSFFYPQSPKTLSALTLTWIFTLTLKWNFAPISHFGPILFDLSDIFALKVL